MRKSAATEPFPDSSTELRERIESVASRLYTAVRSLVQALAGPHPRPGALVDASGIDKSLASRLVKAVKSDSPLHFMHASPSPRGLKILLEASRGTAVGAQRIDVVDETVHHFDDLLREFPEGRPGLDAAISGWLPETRERGEHKARQGVYRSMAYLLGYQADVTMRTIILHPSANGTHYDETIIVGQVGLRRHRVGNPILVNGHWNLGLLGQGTHPTRIEAIDESPASGPQSYFLSRFCTEPIPELEVRHSGDTTLFTLPETEPRLNSAVTLFTGMIVRDQHRLWTDDDQPTRNFTFRPRIPSRVVLSDMYIHDDVFPGVEPQVTLSNEPTSLPSDAPGPESHYGKVDFFIEEASVGHGLVDSADIPDYLDLKRHVFQQIGRDPSDFRVHRIRWAYPLPTVKVTRWFEHP